MRKLQSSRNHFLSKSRSSYGGQYSAKDGAHGTMSSVSVEGVNIMNVVTCDRVVLRLASKHPDGGGEPSFNPLRLAL